VPSAEDLLRHSLPRVVKVMFGRGSQEAPVGVAELLNLIQKSKEQSTRTGTATRLVLWSASRL
jgi:hypothetical protein